MTTRNSAARSGAKVLGMIAAMALAACGGGSAPTDGGSGSDASAGSDARVPLNVCALVTADRVGTILGTTVNMASNADPGPRDEMGITAPGCSYRGSSPFGVATVYALGLMSWQGARDVTTPTASMPVMGAGDEGWVRVEAMPAMGMPAKVLEIGARRNGRNIHIRIFAGATEAQAVALANAFLE